MLIVRHTHIVLGIVCLVLVRGSSPSVLAQYSGGSGTVDDPYQIATPEDIVFLGQTVSDYDKHFVLTADIDLNPRRPGGTAFETAVIAADVDAITPHYEGTPFAGVLNGGGHVISNLTIQGRSYLGLFGKLERGAEIRRLGIVDANVVGSGSFAGALAGMNADCISTTYTTGTINAQEFVGGFVGAHAEGAIADCYSTAQVTGNSQLGGFAGAVGFSSEHPDSVVDAIIANCYSTGVLLGAGLTGGFAAVTELSLDSHSFWDVQTSGQSTSAIGIGLETAEMQTAATYVDAGWDFVNETENGTEDIWWIRGGKDYPRLWWERVLGDDFEDAETAELWMRFEPHVNKAWVTETAGRLEVRTSVLANNVDAGYLSKGWRLDPSEDFSFQIAFHHTKSGEGDSWAMVALLPGLDDPITRIIMFGAGGDTDEQYYFYEGSNGFSGLQDSESRTSHDGTLYVSYDAAKDELYLGHEGYGKPNAWRTITGLLKGSGWQGEPVYVAVGGGADRVVVEPGEVWLDDFILSEGMLFLSE